MPLKHERRDSLYLSRCSAFSAAKVLLVCPANGWLRPALTSMCMPLRSNSHFKWYSFHWARSSSKRAAYYSGFSREDAIFVISIQVTTKEYTCVFTLMFQNGKLRLYSLGVHPNFFRKASLKWLMLLYPTNPAMSFTWASGTDNSSQACSMRRFNIYWYMVIP